MSIPDLVSRRWKNLFFRITLFSAHQAAAPLLT
jgi:hypothetical protein